MSLVAERNTPVRLSLQPTVRSLLEAGTGDEAQATEVVGLHVLRRPADDRVQPDVPARRAHRAGRAVCASSSFTAATKPAVLTGRQEQDGESDTSYRYLLMPVRLSG